MLALFGLGVFAPIWIRNNRYSLFMYPLVRWWVPKGSPSWGHASVHPPRGAVRAGKTEALRAPVF